MVQAQSTPTALLNERRRWTTTDLSPLPVNPDGVPDVLKLYPPALRWIVWRYTFDSNEWRKLPYRTSQPDQTAANDRPGEWSTFDAALAVDLAGKADGVGFMLGRLDDGRYISGYDLDNYIVDGALDAAAVPLVDGWHSYQEISPSGTGIKGICSSDIAAGIEDPSGKDEPASASNSTASVVSST